MDGCGNIRGAQSSKVSVPPLPRLINRVRSHIATSSTYITTSVHLQAPIRCTWSLLLLLHLGLPHQIPPSSVCVVSRGVQSNIVIVIASSTINCRAQHNRCLCISGWPIIVIILVIQSPPVFCLHSLPLTAINCRTLIILKGLVVG